MVQETSKYLSSIIDHVILIFIGIIGALPQDGWLSRFLAATGPAAIATLVAASIWPMVPVNKAEAVPLTTGILVVLAVFGWRRSVVQATMAGAVAFGVAYQLALSTPPWPSVPVAGHGP